MGFFFTTKSITSLTIVFTMMIFIFFYHFLFRKLSNQGLSYFARVTFTKPCSTIQGIQPHYIHLT